MKTEVLYTKNARRDLRKLNHKEAAKIATKIEFYSKQKDPLKHAKKLRPPYDDLYRFRIGDYRAIFEVDNTGTITLLVILKVAHRKEVYE